MINQIMEHVAGLKIIEAKAVNYSFEQGHGGFCLITGENSAGKSVFRKMIASILKKRLNINTVCTSMEQRTTSGTMRILQCIGTENEDGTGYNSLRNALSAMRSIKNSRDDLALFLDEPDIGLSDNFSAGFGVKLREYLENPPANLKATFLVTHRKSLINQLVPLKFHHLRVGDNKTLDQVMSEEIVPTDPEILFEKNIDTRNALSKIFKD